MGWFALVVGTLGLWSHAKAELGKFMPAFYVMAYVGFLVFLNKRVIQLGSASYGRLKGFGFQRSFAYISDELTVGSRPYENVPETLDPAEGGSCNEDPEKVRHEDPELPEELKKDIPAYLASSLMSSYLPVASHMKPISQDVRNALITFNAASLAKDFDVDEDLITAQSSVYEQFLSDGVVSEAVRLSGVAFFSVVLQPSVCVLEAQSMVLVGSRAMCCVLFAYLSAHPFHAITMAPQFGLQCAITTFNERHWYTYLTSLRASSTSNVGKVSAVLYDIWQLL